MFENWNGYDLLDRKRVVRPRESIEWTRRLVNECGIFAGISAGAALAGAAKVASETPSVDMNLIPILDQKYLMARQMAFDGDNDGSPTFIQPNIGVYTR